MTLCTICVDPLVAAENATRDPRWCWHCRPLPRWAMQDGCTMYFATCPTCGQSFGQVSGLDLAPCGACREAHAVKLAAP